MFALRKPRLDPSPPSRPASAKARWASQHSGPGYRILLVGLLLEAAHTDSWSRDDYATFRGLLEQAVARLTPDAVAKWAAACDLAPNLYAWTADEFADGGDS